MPRKQGIYSRRAARRKKEEGKKAALARQKGTESAQEAPAQASSVQDECKAEVAGASDICISLS